MSRADKTATNVTYDFEIDPRTQLPVKMKVLLLTGQKGATITKDDKIVGGDHVAFHFEYDLADFNKTKVKVPGEALKVLRKLR